MIPAHEPRTLTVEPWGVLAGRYRARSLELAVTHGVDRSKHPGDDGWTLCGRLWSSDTYADAYGHPVTCARCLARSAETRPT